MVREVQEAFLLQKVIFYSIPRKDVISDRLAVSKRYHLQKENDWKILRKFIFPFFTANELLVSVGTSLIGLTPLILTYF